MTKEVLKLALEALEGLFGTAEQFEGGGVAVWRLGGSAQPKQAITALRLAIDAQNMASESTYKQQTQEPVLWMMPDGNTADKWALQFYGGQKGKPLYTTPPKREWVGLTDEEDAMTQDGITLTTIRHPRGKPALGDLNPESLETVEIDLPEPIGYVSEGSAERLATNKQAHEQIRSFRLFTHDVPLYRHPQRTWVGLTEKEVEDYWDWEDFQCGAGRGTILEMVRDIEAKLKEKNI